LDVASAMRISAQGRNERVATRPSAGRRAVLL
jgi:hypothetical protein